MFQALSLWNIGAILLIIRCVFKLTFPINNYSSVDLVYSKLSQRQYARKQFIRKKNPRDDQYLLKKFDEEITNLKRLSHQHLVSLIGSYTDQRCVAYLMEPIADCNFMLLLCQPRSFIVERLPSLRNYFGCLASAVAYLHRQRVRHRDLKPQNILIKNHEIYITDFGNALDWSKKGRDTTNDSNAPFTEQYVAPEIAKRSSSSRGSASDVWSLGVVFLEMITVLRGRTIRELRRYLETHGTRHPCVWGNAPATHEWFELIRQVSTGPDSDNEPLMWIKDMTQANPPNRPSSEAIARQIRDTAAMSKFIGQCCAIDDEFEEYPSPPSSHQSDDDADLRIDDIPPELDSGKKGYGSLVENAQQSKIEKWLVQDESVSDVVLGLSDDFDEHMMDVPYDIVMDDPTMMTMIQDEEPAESQSSWTDRFVVLDECDGYDIVQNDSDSECEDRPELGGHGYQVMEDSSDSDTSTVRPTQTGLDDALSDNNTNSNMLTIGYKVISTDDARAIEAHLDSLSDDNVESDIHENSSLSIPAEMSSETQVQGEMGATPLQIGFLPRELLMPAKSLVEADGQNNPEPEPSRHSTEKTRTRVSPKPVSMEEVQDEGIGSAPLVMEKARAKSRERKPRSRVHFQNEDASLLEHEVPATSHQDNVREVGSPATTKEPTIKATRKAPTATSDNATKSGSTVVDPINVADLGTTEPITKATRRKAPTATSDNATEFESAVDPINVADLATTEPIIKAAKKKVSTATSNNATKSESAVDSINVADLATTEPIIKAAKKKASTVTSDNATKSEFAIDFINVADLATTEPIIKAAKKKAPAATSGNASRSGSTIDPLNAANLAKLTDRTVQPSTTLITPKSNNPLAKRRLDGIIADKSYISPSLYMQEVWEAASSAPTSIMSVRTKKAFDSFGSGLAWQDKTAHYLEKYVKTGSAAAVRELLKAGCNPGTKDKPRIRPLMLAVKGGSQRHNKCAQSLLAAGANVNARENSGKTALHYAIENENFRGYTNLIRDLLEAGADPNNKDKSGDFPLLQILYGGYEPLKKHKRDALACLLRPEFATDVNVMPPGTLNMPLHLAVRRKDPWAVSMLLTRGAHVNEPNGSGLSPLMLAANSWGFKMSSDQVEVLRFLLEAGVNVNEQNELGKTALHFAASNLCERAVKLLLSKGADSNISDKDPYPHRAYYYATEPISQVKKASRAHAAILQMFFESRGWSKLSTVDGECPVVTAVVESRIQDVRFLLDHNAAVNHCYESLEKTPLLHVALRNRDSAMSRLLIDKGAYIDLQDQNGRDALAVCASIKQSDFTTQMTDYMNKSGKRKMTVDKRKRESVDQKVPEPGRPEKDRT